MDYKTNLYQRSVLVPFWALQMVFLLVLIGVLGWEIKWFKDTFETINPGWIVIELVLCICIALNVFEMVSYHRQTLAPATLLASQIFKGLFFSIYEVVAIIGIVFGWVSILSLAVITIVVVCFYATLLYAAIVYHRVRNGKVEMRQVYYVGGHPPKNNSTSSSVPTAASYA